MTHIGRRRGKEFEREVAKWCGGRRVGPTGNADYDVEHPVFAFECKEREQLPDWFTGAMTQAKTNADGKTPVVIFKENYGREWYCVLSKEDFAALHIGQTDYGTAQ